MDCSSSVRALAVWLPIGLLAVVAPMVHAGTGGVIRLPSSPAKAKSGLKLEVDVRGVDSSGYRPVRLQLGTLPAVASKRDRRVRVELRTNSFGVAAGSPQVVQTIDLPQGKLQAEATLALPQFGRWTSVFVQVSEGGRQIDELSGWYNPVTIGRYYGWSEAAPAILLIDLDAPTRDERERLEAAFRVGGQTVHSKAHQLPDYRGLVATIPTDEFDTLLNTNSKRLDDQFLLRALGELPKVELLAASDLPTRWIDYSCYDLVTISYSDLRRLEKEYPDRFAALRQWTRMGATLVIFDLGSDFERLPQLEAMLGVPPQADGEDGDSDVLAGWTRPAPKAFGDQVLRSIQAGSSSTVNGMRVTRRSSSIRDEPQDELYELARKPPAKAPFVIRPLDFGALVAFSEVDPFPGSVQKWCWMLNSLGEERYKWHVRYGASQHRPNVEFWEWLIPGVGQAPVVSFLVLITLFALVIGPVNYTVLRRLRRRYLLMITVPLGAALVTAALFGYALITDGLGTKVRVRGVTWLDQTTGEASSWSRQTYYSSIAPSRGLEFPTLSLVFPIYGEPRNNGRRGGRATRRLNWEQRQRLDRDYLQSRVMSQFVVGSAGPSDAELVVRASADKGPPTVENLLAPRIDQLLLRDERGELFRAEDLKKNQSAALRPVTSEEAGEWLMAAFEAKQPRAPGKLDTKTYREAFVFELFRFNSGNDVDPSEIDAGFKGSLLERNLLQYLEFPDQLPRRHYVAIVSGGSPVPIGVRNARRVASYDLIIGRW